MPSKTLAESFQRRYGEFKRSVDERLLRRILRDVHPDLFGHNLSHSLPKLLGDERSLYENSSHPSDLFNIRSLLPRKEAETAETFSNAEIRLYQGKNDGLVLTISEGINVAQDRTFIAWNFDQPDNPSTNLFVNLPYDRQRFHVLPDGSFLYQSKYVAGVLVRGDDWEYMNIYDPGFSQEYAARASAFQGGRFTSIIPSDNALALQIIHSNNQKQSFSLPIQIGYPTLG